MDKGIRIISFPANGEMISILPHNESWEGELTLFDSIDSARFAAYSGDERILRITCLIRECDVIAQVMFDDGITNDSVKAIRLLSTYCFKDNTVIKFLEYPSGVMFERIMLHYAVQLIKRYDSKIDMRCFEIYESS